MRRKMVVIFGASVCLVGVAVAIIFLLSNHDTDLAIPNISDSKTQSGGVDFEAPSIEEITKKYPDINERYQVLVNYAYLKLTSGKTATARVLYEAAASLAVAKGLQQEAQYQLYLIAASGGDTKKANYYLKLLGSDYFTKQSKGNRDE